MSEAREIIKKIETDISLLGMSTARLDVKISLFMVQVTAEIEIQKRTLNSLQVGLDKIKALHGEEIPARLAAADNGHMIEPTS
jgi:ABC-type uncharacterized transport system ATPase component